MKRNRSIMQHSVEELARSAPGDGSLAFTYFRHYRSGDFVATARPVTLEDARPLCPPGYELREENGQIRAWPIIITDYQI